MTKLSKINYNNRIFQTVSNSETGEVSDDTKFFYKQKDYIVYAEYLGGEIVFGQLAAKILDDGCLDMRYQHINKSGELMTGKCLSIPEILENGKLRLHETWEWTCGDFSKGKSVIEEI